MCAVPLRLDRLLDGNFSGQCPSVSGPPRRLLLTISADGLVRGTVFAAEAVPFLETDRVDSSPVRLVDGGRRRERGRVVADVMGTAHLRRTDETLDASTVKPNGNASAAEDRYYCCLVHVVTTGRPQVADPCARTCHLHVPFASDAPAIGTWQLRRHSRWQRDVHQQLPQVKTASSRGSLLSCTALQGLRTAASSSMALQGLRTAASSSMALPEFCTAETFQLVPVQCPRQAAAVAAAVLPVDNGPERREMPLRPGKYEFKGFTTTFGPVAAVPGTRNGRRSRYGALGTTRAKDNCLVTLYLQADGTVHGTSCEVAQPQVCRLTGRWKANRIAYVLEYRVREAVGHFRYSGAIAMKPRATLTGRWHNVDKGHVDGYQGGRGTFELELVRVDLLPIAVKWEKSEEARTRPSDCPHEQVHLLKYSVGSSSDLAIDLCDDDNAIQTFTSGEYELSGRAIDADGYEYAFDLKLKLCPDGKLLGQCTERVFQQLSPISGHWDPTHIVYDQQYVVKGEVGLYTYTAAMSCNGVLVQGTWVNAEAELASASSEHGTFGLIVLHSTRRWSTSSHSRYPPRFRRAVWTTLLTSARRNILPGAVWAHIFSFCSETWFTAPKEPLRQPLQVAVPFNMLTCSPFGEPPRKRCKHAA